MLRNDYSEDSYVTKKVARFTILSDDMHSITP
jgi:hypothetical protein